MGRLSDKKICYQQDLYQFRVMKNRERLAVSHTMTILDGKEVALCCRMAVSHLNHLLSLYEPVRMRLE